MDLTNPVDLSGKVAVVTGSGRGLGLAYARALAAAGAAVVVNDVDAGAVEAAVAGITAAGGRALGVVAAVGGTDAAEQLVARAVEGFGRLDVMVTNAGILRDRVLWKMTDDDFDSVVEVHLRGTFTCARAAAVRMREQGEGGRLVLIASPAGQRGNFGQTNYAAAKAGIAAMARTWALELARAGVTVNAVVPVAATEMTKTIPAFAPLIEESERTGAPLPDRLRKDEGLGTVEDAAALITFLASDASAGVTGQAIGIGGDRLALWAHPQEKAVAFADGGWSPEEIAARWHDGVGAEPETYGIPAPKVPGTSEDGVAASRPAEVRAAASQAPEA
ncbi:SDR family oxidoreductase [Streptomyces sp. NPDC004690]